MEALEWSKCMLDSNTSVSTVFSQTSLIQGSNMVFYALTSADPLGRL